MSPRLLMLGAMYENGGNTTHRLLDGHPNFFVYPFESQLGTKLVQDPLASLFPLKYRWPVFPLDSTAFNDYKLIIDEEAKVRSRTPHVSKFRHVEVDLSDDERCEIYCQLIGERGRSRPNNVIAFFEATFKAWRNYCRSGQESFFVGYSPILVVDADKILRELPDAHFLHVVRNPWSAYADTKKRPVPMSLPDYMLAWTTNQYFALLFKKMFPDRFHIVRIEDVLADSYETLGTICKALAVPRAESLRTPTFNGVELSEVYPWGTIRKASSEANLATAAELSDEEKLEIGLRAGHYLEAFSYSEIVPQVAAEPRGK